MAKQEIRKQSITQLIQAIRDEIEAGKASAMKALENEKSVTYWNVGQKIYDFIKDARDKASYGNAVIQKVAAGLNIGERTLYRALQFYTQYPEKISPSPSLTWTHYLLLLSVKDESIRHELENRIFTEHLSTRELEEIIKNLNLLEYDYIKRLKIRRGQPYLFSIKRTKIRNREFQYVDLGFKVFLDKPIPAGVDFQDGTIIEAKKRKDSYTFTEIEHDKYHLLYTYPAYVIEVIDGDTIRADIDLGFEVWTIQKIRLRGINAESLDTETGKKAKEFLETQLLSSDMVIIKTYWRDKFNRYLGDIFYSPGETDILTIAATGNYLNQELLDNRLAEEY